MKINLKFLSIAAAFVFAACDIETPTPEVPDVPVDPEVEKELNQNLAFTVEVVEVGSDVAKIKVKHNGSAEDTWYGFLTEKVSSTDALLIDSEVTRIFENGTPDGLMNQTIANVTLDKLNPLTEYKYIVFGVSEEGEIYGKSTSVKFTTTKAVAVLTENSAWTVEYKGAGVIDGVEYDHTVTVKSTDQNKYFITAVTKASIDKDGVETVAKSELQGFKEYIDAFNAEYGTNYTLDKLLYQGDGIEAFMLEPGIDWYAIAVGVDADGDFSGLYAMSDVINIKEADLEPEYAEWIGSWTITGANGITQDVVFSKGVANKSFKMTGYEGSATEGLDVRVDWDSESGAWYIMNQNFGTFSFGDYGDGEVWFLGADEVGNLFLSEEFPICVGGKMEDGSIAALPYTGEVEVEEGEIFEYSVSNMMYIVYLLDYQQLSYLSGTYETGYPTFPLTFTQNNTKAPLSVDADDVRVVTGLVKPFKSYGFLK